MVTEQLPVVVDLARRVALVDRLVLVFAGLLVLRVGSTSDQSSWLLALVLPSVVAETGRRCSARGSSSRPEVPRPARARGA